MSTSDHLKTSGSNSTSTSLDLTNERSKISFTSDVYDSISGSISLSDSSSTAHLHSQVIQMSKASQCYKCICLAPSISTSMSMSASTLSSQSTSGVTLVINTQTKYQDSTSMGISGLQSTVESESNK